MLAPRPVQKEIDNKDVNDKRYSLLGCTVDDLNVGSMGGRLIFLTLSIQQSTTNPVSLLRAKSDAVQISVQPTILGVEVFFKTGY